MEVVTMGEATSPAAGTGRRTQAQARPWRAFPRNAATDEDPVAAAVNAAAYARLTQGVAMLGDVLLLLGDAVTEVDDELAAGARVAPARLELYRLAHVVAGF